MRTRKGRRITHFKDRRRIEECSIKPAFDFFGEFSHPLRVQNANRLDDGNRSSVRFGPASAMKEKSRPTLFSLRGQDLAWIGTL